MRRRCWRLRARLTPRLRVRARSAWAAAQEGQTLSAALLGGAGDEPPAAPPTAAELCLKPRAAVSVAAFYGLVARWVALARTATVADLLACVIEDVGYRKYVQDEEASGEEGARWGNVHELLNLAATPLDAADGLPAPPGTPAPAGLGALRSFLENAALMSNTDMAARDDPDAVRLMTMHGAKGLEFDAVFVVGLEEGTLPSQRALDGAGPGRHRLAALEEERRLMYVAVTRARRLLYLCYARWRSVYGKGDETERRPSRFLAAVMEALGGDASLAAPRDIEGRARDDRAGQPVSGVAREAPRPQRPAWGRGAEEEVAEEEDEEEAARRTGGRAAAWDVSRRRLARPATPAAKPRAPARAAAAPRAAAPAAARRETGCAEPPPPASLLGSGLRRPMAPQAQPKPPVPAPVDAATRAQEVSSGAAEMQAQMLARAAAAKAKRAANASRLQRTDR
jgi:ATP-dependent exoDNAse (exonuclease V) beta subunit